MQLSTLRFAIFYEPKQWGVFRGDVQRFGRLLRNETRPGPKELITNPTVGQIETMFRSAPRIATDIETAAAYPEAPWTGKDPTQAKLKCIGLGNTEWGLALDCRRNHVAQKEAIRKGFRNPNIAKVTLNGPWFDHRVLGRYGFPITNWEDCRDARRALSATSRVGLAFQASIYDDCNPWKEDEEEDSKGLVFTEDMGKLLRYCAQDCVETARVDEGILAEPDWPSERVQCLYTLHKDLSVLCAEMHEVGFPVHKVYRDFLAWGLAEEYKQHEETLLKMVNIKGFRCTPNDMRALIFRRHSTSSIRRFELDDPVDPDCWTETGSCSVDFDSLLQIIVDPYAPEELKQIIRVYWKAESTKKARSTFVASAEVSQAIGPDGCLRPGWNSCGTDTGRFSCSEPNIMNLEQYLRYMYCAQPGMDWVYGDLSQHLKRKPPEWTIVHADYSQLELRVMRAVSKDEVLGEALLSGDVYASDARALFPQVREWDNKKIKTDAKGKKARRASKQVHLAFQYGAGLKKVFAQVLAEDPEADFSKVGVLFDAMRKRYNGTVSYWYKEQARVRRDGYSESRVLQRRRQYPRDPPITEVANYPIQGTASDVMNLATLRLWRRLAKEATGAKIVGQLHDALDVRSPLNMKERVECIMKEEMEVPVEIEGKKYVFPVEIKCSPHWGDL